MLNKIFCITSLLAVFLVTGCSNAIYKPSAVEEYEHPYALSETHQALPVGVTQQVIEQRSDVVIIKQDAEFVYWTPTNPTLIMVNTKNSIEEEIEPTIVKKPVINVNTEEAALFFKAEENELAKFIAVDKPARTCKKIFCDEDKTDECGAIAWCGDDYCPKDKELDEVYDCSGEQCVARFVHNSILDYHSCSDPSLSIHPDCLGKGEQGCIGHQELFYCNNLSRECTEN